MQEKLPISLVTIVRNAGGRLRKLIEAHRDLVSEVIVVDQGSTDGTYEEAVELADKVFRKKRKGVSDPDRLWAHSLGSYTYVLYLDDDESLSIKAREALTAFVKADFDCIWFNRLNLVDGVDIFPILKEDPQLRLFKRGSVRYAEKDHVYPEVANGVKVAHSPYEIIHERTLVGMKASNLGREGLYSKKHIEMQHHFIQEVEALVLENQGFTENWYSSSQLNSLRGACGKVTKLEGAVIEIGCWEGKSTCTIANMLKDDVVQAVDTWQGNLTEGESHPSVVAAKERDVFGQFNRNVERLTKGNVNPLISDCFDYIQALDVPVKFAHIDAAHDYASVKKTIASLKKHLVVGGVLCGDAFISANAKRSDLGGGVERAVVEECPGFVSQENFWYWINK